MDKPWAMVIAILLIATTCLSQNPLHGNENDDDGPLTADNFPYHDKLDDKYQLQWKFNSTHIVFQTRVKTTGYIGFGISAHGSMYPSDVIIAWVKDGHVHFADRHAKGHFLPTVDAHQDWHLVSGSEDGQNTTITFLRQLNTCDSDDLPITSDTSRVIYAYSTSDPSNENNIHYHGSTRGTKSILLLDPPANAKEENKLPDDFTTIDFLNNNYSVPIKDTTYSCNVYKLPDLKGKHHLIRYDPVIQKGHEKLVHHILIYFCRNPINEDLIGTEYECYGKDRNQDLDLCNHVIVAWAIGGTNFYYPPHVGHSLGDVDDPIYFRMETHYDNVHMRDDFVDNSGIRIYLTKQLRHHDAGMLEVGISVNKFQIIPPYNDNFLSSGHCHESCIAKGLGDDEIHIFADMLHAHLIGKAISTRQIRNGTELPPILEDKNYDFDYQEMRLLREEKVVKKGDTLITDCYYDSTKRTGITFGGLSSRKEMCLSFLLYYPKKPLSECVSRPAYSGLADQRAVFNVISEMDWTKKEIRDSFSNMIDHNKTISICLLDNHYEYNWRSLPSIAQPFVPEDHCKPE